LITGLKNTLSEFKTNDNDFDVVYDTIKFYVEFNIKIPKVRKQTISCIVDPNEDIQHTRIS
jgi:hypothetical protein